MDFFELEEVLNADVLDHNTVLRETHWTIRLTRRLFGVNVALAAAAMRHLDKYDVVLSGAERVGIPLAIMMRLGLKRNKHSMVCHLLTPNKKQIPFKLFGLAGSIDSFVCQNAFQAGFLQSNLSVSAGRVHYIRSVPVDQRFYHPIKGAKDEGVVAVGRELRDYATLVEATRGLDIPVHIVASSPWSVRQNQFGKADPEQNVTVTSGHSYIELREIYAGARFVALPLFDVDSPAGITALVESMSMGKATIVSASRGIVDFVDHMETGILVKPGDPEELRKAILYLQNDPAEAARIGNNARKVAESEVNIDCYTERVARAIANLREQISPEEAFQI